MTRFGSKMTSTMKTLGENYIKIRLTGKLKDEILARADRLGLTMSGYLQYLAVKDVAEREQRLEIFLLEDINEAVKQLMKIKLKKSLTLLKK